MTVSTDDLSRAARASDRLAAAQAWTTFSPSPDLDRRMRANHPLIDTPPDLRLRACVVVPARDEEDGVAATLAALANQVDAHGAPLSPASYEVVVLANNCTDRTAAVARSLGKSDFPALRLHVVETTLPAEQAHVVHARQLLMDEAYRRLRLVGAPRGVIASTDGDTRVSPRWLSATLRAVAAGADAVGGRIVIDRADLKAMDEGARSLYRWDTLYSLLTARLEACLDPDPADPWPRHHQYFGGSLAVTAAAYAAVGGLPSVSSLEDMTFHRLLLRADARVRHSPAVRVVTSGRSSARVAVGLSTQLHMWACLHANGQPYLVESAASREMLFRTRRALRLLWLCSRAGRAPDRAAVAALAADLCVDAPVLGEAILSAPTFGILWEEAREASVQGVDRWARRWPIQEVEDAARTLHALLPQARREARARSRNLFE